MLREQRVLGVLGGMGPLASAQFMVRLTELTPAQNDQDHIPAILWSDPRVPDRSAAWLGLGEDPTPSLLRAVAGLEAAGAGAIVVPCNTAHGWFAAMQRATAVPILHIADAAMLELGRAGVPDGPIGLLATEGALAMRLYQDRLQARGHDCVTPTEGEMRDLVSPAIAMVKANRIADASQRLSVVAHRLIDRGALGLILGCTELPLAYTAGAALPCPVVDTIDALARSAIDWARKGRLPG
jgi:aspartate racemase